MKLQSSPNYYAQLLELLEEDWKVLSRQGSEFLKRTEYGYRRLLLFCTITVFGC